ncbi:serine aminopeptidase domain-containing protein [Maricaulis parjimensis]|uniref:alpha/beta hydrolase family protein n=1 Tax=Maricaulis parjimensis TaxID=144023 RepID=UPI00193994A9|nr:alpha/beta hydrolase [Maricaulis parjimensis]
MTQLIQENEIRFDARDGYSLSGRILAPDNPKAAVLISSGTGFPKGFYRKIAAQGAEQGFACLIYDYRGVAGSAPDRLRGFQADILDWARLDFPAALDRAADLAPGKPVFTLGHSVGGHLVGFADNADRARAHAFVCCGSGYWGSHDPAYIPRALLFWLGIGPLNLALKGHIAEGGLWGGTALPKPVFQQWRNWAFRKRYFGDLLGEIEGSRFDTLTTPIRNYTFTDDQLASERSAREMMSLYSAANPEIVRLSPQDVGARKVDHAGAFSREAAGFWPLPFEWFETYL